MEKSSQHGIVLRFALGGSAKRCRRKNRRPGNARSVVFRWPVSRSKIGCQWPRRTYVKYANYACESCHEANALSRLVLREALIERKYLRIFFRCRNGFELRCFFLAEFACVAKPGRRHAPKATPTTTRPLDQIAAGGSFCNNIRYGNDFRSIGDCDPAPSSRPAASRRADLSADSTGRAESSRCDPSSRRDCPTRSGQVDDAVDVHWTGDRG